MTTEEAGRRAFERSAEAVVRKQRLEQLLQAVDHTDDDENENDIREETASTSTNLATLLAHAGIESGDRENVPMSPPLHTATTYTRPPDGIYKDGDSIYARMDNPTRLLLEKTVYELECSGVSHENGESSLAFSSGMQAVTAILLAHATSGAATTTVLIPNDVYHGVRTLLSDVFCRHGVSVRELDMVGGTGADTILDMISEIAKTESTTNADNNRHRSSVIVWMETPSNPKCQVVDIKSICDALQSAGDGWGDVLDVTTVVDGTMASPVLTRPLELGADLSFHSGTKYLGGHSDALLGTVTASPVTSRGKELYPLLKSVQIAGGGVASPWDSWLVLRGMRTLHVRVERQCKTALSLAEYLEEKMDDSSSDGEDNDSSSPWMSEVAVKAVHYPGLASHPQHAIASKQMVLATGGESSSCYGGVLSFELDTELEATAFAAALRVCQRATSLGGTETLVEHRASIEPPGAVVSPPGLLRVSVGLEDAGDLIRDFEEAFAVVAEVMHAAQQMYICGVV